MAKGERVVDSAASVRWPSSLLLSIYAQPKQLEARTSSYHMMDQNLVKKKRSEQCHRSRKPSLKQIEQTPTTITLIINSPTGAQLLSILKSLVQSDHGENPSKNVQEFKFPEPEL